MTRFYCDEFWASRTYKCHGLTSELKNNPTPKQKNYFQNIIWQVKRAISALSKNNIVNIKLRKASLYVWVSRTYRNLRRFRNDDINVHKNNLAI